MKIKSQIKSFLTAAIFLIISVSFIYADPDAARFSSWQTLGPNGGDIRAIAIDPRDKNRLFITTLDSQIYSSADGGKNWQFLYVLNRPQIALDNLLVDVEDSNSVYVTGHRHKEAGGFLYTRDGGKTWKEAKDLKNEAIHAFAQSSKNPNLMVVGGPGKIFISYNRGEDWKRITDEKIAFINLFVDSLAFDPRDTNTIYAGTSWRPYKSTDGGKTWRLIANGMISDSDIFAMDINPQNPDDMIFSACSGIYRTSNAGELWSKIRGIPDASRRTKALLRNPAWNGEIYAGTTEGFWMSADNGKTWSLTTQRELEVNNIAVHPDEPKKVYITTNNYGLMVSKDGGRSFSVQNGNFTSRFIYQIVADVQKPNRFYAVSNNTATGGSFIFISEDGGQSWIPANKNLSVIRVKTFDFLQDKANPDTIYIGTNLGIYRSLDRGRSWNQITASAPPKPAGKKKPVTGKTTPAAAPATTSVTASGAKKVAALKEAVRALSHTNDGKNGMLAVTDKGLYRTYNIATGWEKLSFGEGINEQVFAVHASESQPNTIWAGTVRSGVVVSRDNGLTWQRVTGVPSETPILAIKSAPQNPNLIFVGTTQTFYLSRDGGQNWVRRGGGLPVGNYGSILVNPNNPNEVFAGSSWEGRGGVFQSVDAGNTWQQLDTKDLNLPTRRVWAMTFDPQNPNKILVGTHSAGIYRLERAGSANTNETGTRPRVATNEN